MEIKYLQKIHVEDQSFEDLDIRLQDEIGIDYDINEEYEIIEVGQGHADGYSVRIDQMIEKLVYLNSLGATHVELSHHEDHIGYDISGFTLRLSTEREIFEYEEAQRLRQLAQLTRVVTPINTDEYPF